MLTFLRVWWPALVVIGILLAVWGYGQWQRHDAESRAKDKATIGALKSDVESRATDAETRKLQNEIIVRDISPAEFDRVLSDSRF